ncbi:DivIVA domain-containing protein [Parafrankia discariae]|uniref:DivIVA domain-containing protein n=1 Tax=Parafrankia discariae TaxID=365528 RepID=UPI0012B6A33F|nr:DivIVA domain-containing protein [Parafrankia discariae]
MVLAVEIVLVAVVVFVVAALAVGRFDRMAPAVPDGPHTGLGARSVVADDVADVRFGMAARGYRMAEVDAVLARLAYEIAWRDEELARRDDELVRLAEFAHLGVAANANGYTDAGVDPGVDVDPEADTDTDAGPEKPDPEPLDPERPDANGGDTRGPAASTSEREASAPGENELG